MVWNHSVQRRDLKGCDRLVESGRNMSRLRHRGRVRGEDQAMLASLEDGLLGRAGYRDLCSAGEECDVSEK